MPVALLLVEGNLDSELLASILSGDPVVKPGGTKAGLKTQTRTMRHAGLGNVAAGYLRDRDFDFDPPENTTAPCVDHLERGIPLGWRWCRHTIENYLLEPALIAQATASEVGEVETVLRSAARTIRYYQAARWTVGTVRQKLPPNWELETRPDLNDIAVPDDLSRDGVFAWASQSIQAHRTPIIDATDSVAVESSFSRFVNRFDEAFVADLSNVLLWFSGKDLLASIDTAWLRSKRVTNTGDLRGKTRDWVMANADAALDLLPEWKALRDALRSSP